MRFAILALAGVLVCCGSLAPMSNPGPAVVLDGRIVGLNRQGLPGVAVSLCSTSEAAAEDEPCRDATTGEQGEFQFPLDDGDLDSILFRFALHAQKPGDTSYAELDFPLYTASRSQDGIEWQLPPLVLPRVDTSAAVTEGQQDFLIDSTLTLSFDGGKLRDRHLAPVSRVGGVRIPADLFPDFCVPSMYAVAMWAFSPTGMTSGSPITVSLSDSLGLPPGTQVGFIEIDPQDGSPTQSTWGTVSEDGQSIRTAIDQGVHRLSWLLITVWGGGP